MKYETKKISIGKPKIDKFTNKVSKPKKKYRIIIHQKPIKGNNTEAQTCFTVYDHTGKTTINSIKKNFLKLWRVNKNVHD